MLRNPRLVPPVAFASALCLSLLGAPARTGAEGDADKGKMLLTIFLKHDLSLTLDEINARQEKAGFRKAFPPEGVEVVSWYVMMGVGQVVTVRLSPEKLREVNRMIEQKAWGPNRTEFYATYDFRPVVEAEKHKTGN